MNLNDYAKECFSANRLWWVQIDQECPRCQGSGSPDADCPDCLGTGHPRIQNRNIGELLMLCVSELAEAMEGHRKGLMDDKLPDRRMFDVELADCMIRIFDLCGGLGVDLDMVFREKMAFNRNRKDHSKNHRLGPGGKKY